MTQLNKKTKEKSCEDLEREGWMRHRDSKNHIYYLTPLINDQRRKIRMEKNLKRKIIGLLKTSV